MHSLSCNINQSITWGMGSHPSPLPSPCDDKIRSFEWRFANISIRISAKHFKVVVAGNADVTSLSKECIQFIRNELTVHIVDAQSADTTFKYIGSHFDSSWHCLTRAV